MATVKKKRTRLAPDVRKDLILDRVADIVATEGVSSLSMDRIGKEAGISKSLVYSYFPTIKEMLQTLLKREYERLRALQDQAAQSAETFEQLVRRVTTAYLTYMEERGLILDRLTAEPNLTDISDPTEFSRDTAVRHLAKIVRDHFDIDMEIALPAVDISFGMPAAAGHYLIKNNVPRQTIEDITVAMIIGSIEALAKSYKTSFKLIKKKPVQI
ncbi:TetR/AcrR family transcriptional regulator [Shewanella sp. MF05960]|uniref:TetR/AcrR family transcriptional regulator n=1 Tax=Shewanella sp. MF05960 TaxID=3434874 RepID=UPI003D795C38